MSSNQDAGVVSHAARSDQNIVGSFNLAAVPKKPSRADKKNDADINDTDTFRPDPRFWAIIFGLGVALLLTASENTVLLP